jgi:ATP/ADP translocase
MKTYEIVILVFFIVSWGWILKYLYRNYKQSETLDRKALEEKRRRQDEYRRPKK